jgi:hypothetical protein
MLGRKLEMNRIFHRKQSLPGLYNAHVASAISATKCFSIHALASSIQHCESDNSKRKENAQVQEEVW